MVNDSYLAGLFDGEGCVSMSLARKGYITLSVRVAMCDSAPVKALYDRFGGCYDDGKRKTPHGRQVFVWAVYNADAVEALRVFAAACLVKSAVAQIALPVAENMQQNPTRGVLSTHEKEARLAAAQALAAINKPVGVRRVLDSTACAAYMKPKKMGGGKPVRLSDGREFASSRAAARVLGVSDSAAAHAARKKHKVCALSVEYV